ncbi:MAG: hypothetical protein WCS17_01725 [Prevotella sp.]
MHLIDFFLGASVLAGLLIPISDERFLSKSPGIKKRDNALVRIRDTALKGHNFVAYVAVSKALKRLRANGPNDRAASERVFRDLRSEIKFAGKLDEGLDSQLFAAEREFND